MERRYQKPERGYKKTEVYNVIKKTGPRVHSPKPPLHKTGLLFPLERKGKQCCNHALGPAKTYTRRGTCGTMQLKPRAVTENGRGTEQVKTGQVILDHLSRHFRGHFRGRLPATFSWELLFRRVSETPNPYSSLRKYGSTSPICTAVRPICIAGPSWLLSLEERETQQYTSNLYCSTTPICTAVRLPFVRQYF